MSFQHWLVRVFHSRHTLVLLKEYYSIPAYNKKQKCAFIHFLDVYHIAQKHIVLISVSETPKCAALAWKCHECLCTEVYFSCFTFGVILSKPERKSLPIENGNSSTMHLGCELRTCDLCDTFCWYIVLKWHNDLLWVWHGCTPANYCFHGVWKDFHMTFFILVQIRWLSLCVHCVYASQVYRFKFWLVIDSKIS